MKFLELLCDRSPVFFENEKIGGQLTTLALARLLILGNKAEQSKRTAITQNLFMVDDL